MEVGGGELTDDRLLTVTNRNDPEYATNSDATRVVTVTCVYSENRNPSVVHFEAAAILLFGRASVLVSIIPSSKFQIG